jgi:hypothetical protein
MFLESNKHIPSRSISNFHNPIILNLIEFVMMNQAIQYEVLRLTLVFYPWENYPEAEIKVRIR